MKKILLVNQSSGYLMVDIVNAYVKSGNYAKVELFTGEINIRPSIPDQSVHIIKTIKYDKSSTIKRLTTWLCAFLHLLFVVWKRNNNCKLVLVSNPPLTIFIPLFTRKNFSYVVYDLYPDTLFSQGYIKKKSLIGKWWIKKNKKVFAKAEYIYTLSEDMRHAVGKYVSQDKIRIVYNWVHNEHIKPIAKDKNIFLANINLQDKFIVLYSGNMGMTHNIDILVDVANKIKKNNEIHFIFIGDGAKKTIIQEKIEEYGLNNCTLLPYQTLDMLPFSIGASDIAVVSTDPKQSGLSVPSKTYTYLAAGSALLCLANEETELGRLTNKYQVGQCFDSSDLEGITTFILTLKRDQFLLNQYKTNSRKTSLLYSPENAKQYVI